MQIIIQTEGNRELSRLVQEKRFSMGIFWTSNQRVVQCCESSYLYVSGDSITHGNIQAVFREYSIDRNYKVVNAIEFLCSDSIFEEL